MAEDREDEIKLLAIGWLWSAYAPFAPEIRRVEFATAHVRTYIPSWLTVKSCASVAACSCSSRTTFATYREQKPQSHIALRSDYSDARDMQITVEVSCFRGLCPLGRWLGCLLAF